MCYRIKVENLICYSGGLELLFSNERKHDIVLPLKDEFGKATNVAFLVRFLCEKVMKDPRKEMFIFDGTVSVSQSNITQSLLMFFRRPGVLVLINDADWELEGGDQYELRNGDEIFFVSTLHGG